MPAEERIYFNYTIGFIRCKEKARQSRVETQRGLKVSQMVSLLVCPRRPPFSTFTSMASARQTSLCQ